MADSPRIIRHYIHVDDLLPEVFLSITKESDGSVLNLTGYTNFVFSMTPRGGVTPVINAVAATLLSASSLPQLKYSWVVGDTAVQGIYHALFNAEDSNGKRVSYPNDGFIEVYVLRKLRTT